MTLADTFPFARALKTLLCSVSNKWRLPKLICSYLTDRAQSVDAETIYSVGSHGTNVSTQQPVQNYSFYQSEADTVLFFAYAVLRESGYSGPVVIGAADTDAYVAAAVILQQLPDMFCIKRKQESSSSSSQDMSTRVALWCREVVENEEQIIHPSPSRCRSLPPRQLPGVSSALPPPPPLNVF